MLTTRPRLHSPELALLSLFCLLALSCGVVGCSNSEPNPASKPMQACNASGLHSFEHGECEPMDAAGEGDCSGCELGYSWDGSDCVKLDGCGCVGDDCDSLAETEGECLEQHEGCRSEALTTSCGRPALTVPHTDCAPMDAVSDQSCNCMMGYIWDGSKCRPIGGCRCIGADCQSVTETHVECLDAHATCVETPPENLCEALNVQGDGICHTDVGYAWNGSKCERLTGCKCVGDDCDRINQTEEECLEQHEECRSEVLTTGCGRPIVPVPHTDCAPMDAVSDQSCNCMMGYIWDGSKCRPIGGCRCIGADCQSVTETHAECLDAHAACLLAPQPSL